MTSPPIFGEEGARWSLGSRVVAAWWVRETIDGVELAHEHVAEGDVSALVLGEDDTWLVGLYFGPIPLRGRPAWFTPEQITPV